MTAPRRRGIQVAGHRSEDGTLAVTIYHNPRCSKSRATLKLLEDKGVEVRIVEYLKTPPSKAEMKNILDGLGMEPRELMRRKEAPYKDLKLADESLGKDELIEAMVENPVLMERPVVVNNGKYALGRPPENVLSIL